ncbi:MAG: tail fiber domain-containing protein [Bacteroidetes bacterium]|nr:tail fiber domain-containing protein [Bacteroidota bacterium]
MKKNFTISLLVLLAFIAVNVSMAQAPEKFKYQAVLRDASGNIIANSAVTVIINILQGSASGTSIYQETQNVTTTAQGVINLDLGAGTVNSGVFATINWSTYNYWVKVTLGGTVISTGQLLSVPYSLKVKGIELDPITGNIGIGNPTPGFKLDVNGVIHSGVDNGACFRVGNDATINDINQANQLGIYGTTDATIGSIKLGSGGGVISGKSDFIGIGTYNPTSRLHILGTASEAPARLTIESPNTTFGPEIRLLSTGTNGLDWRLWSSQASNPSGAGNFEIWNSTLGSVFTIKGSSGNLGIGTTNPAQKLEVAGNIAIKNPAGDASLYIGPYLRQAIGYFGGWDANMLYINGNTSWGSGVTIGHDQALSDLYVNGNLIVKRWGSDCSIQLGANAKRSMGYYPGWDPNKLFINGWGDWSGGTQISNYLNITGTTDAQTVYVNQNLTVRGGNAFLKNNGSGDVSLWLGSSSWDKRSMGYYSGWDGNMLYINGWRDWGSGVSIGHWQGFGNGLGECTNLYLQGTGYSQWGYLTFSDGRFKMNVETMTNSLDKVLKMRGVTYTAKSCNISSFGFIAQELEQVFPLAVNTDNFGYKSVNYANLTAVLAEAIKELNAKVENLEKENAQLKAENNDFNALKAEVEELKTLMRAGKLLGSK